jgi:hypothetical protein
MDKNFKIYMHKKTISILLVLSLFSCYTYNTDLNKLEKIEISSTKDIKKGKACGNYLFGGFEIPYVGETSIKLSGDQSVITAIKNGNIKKIYAIDTLKKSYVFYSKRCTIVFGE